MSIYAIADLHLSLAPGTEKPMDIFGDRLFNHTERIKENWCRTIKDEDTVVVAGDISWALKMEEAVVDLDWIDSLPGQKVILKGNHDLWWNGITKMNRMYDTITFLQHDSFCPENEKSSEGGRIWICGSRGWITPDDDGFTETDEKIYNRELLRLESSLNSAGMEEGDEILGFLHYPPVSDARRFSGFMQMFEDFGVKNVYFGHVHGEDNFHKAIQGNYHGIEYKLISADYLNCCPLLVR